MFNTIRFVFEISIDGDRILAIWTSEGLILKRKGEKISISRYKEKILLYPHPKIFRRKSEKSLKKEKDRRSPSFHHLWSRPWFICMPRIQGGRIRVIIVTIWFPTDRVFSFPYPSDLPVHGDYALEVTLEGVKFGRDAGIVRIGGETQRGIGEIPQ